MGFLSGFTAHLPTNSDIDKLVDMRMQWVRMDFSWAQIEFERGKFNWEPWDKAVDYAVSNGLKVYATLGKTPSWCGDYPNGVPDIFEWQCFVEEISNRYMDKISVYSLWNEPNLSQFWAGSMGQYIDSILVPSSHILIGKGLLVAAPDLSTHGKSWVKWLNELVNHQSHYDILSIHVYEDSVHEIEASFSRGRHGILQYLYEPWKPYNNWLKNIEKPIWLTGVGWRSDLIGINEQASRYLQLMCNGVPSADNIIAYELRDDPDVVEKWGVLNSNWSDKPAAMIIANG